MASVAQALAASHSVGVLAMTDTVLFTDHGVVVVAILTSAMALIFSVLGLATTRHMRSEIQHQFGGSSTNTAMSDDHTPNEWNLLKEQFHALVREGSNNVENIFDAQFRTRFSELIYRSAGFENPSHGISSGKRTPLCPTDT
jgi:hypothetical protein